MKTSTLVLATLLGLAFARAEAQTQSSTTTTTTYVQASKVVGMKVNDSRGEEIGVVKDVVLDRNTGCMAYTVLSTGGTGTRVSGALDRWHRYADDRPGKNGCRPMGGLLPSI